LSLLNDVKQTVNDLRNLSGADISNSQRGVIEDRYEKIEEKITGTKEIVDFKNPEFITQAIGNLEAFEKALSGALKVDQGTTESREPAKKPEDLRSLVSGEQKVETSPAVLATTTSKPSQTTETQSSTPENIAISQ
jgi:hypothetical protein